MKKLLYVAVSLLFSSCNSTIEEQGETDNTLNTSSPSLFLESIKALRTNEEKNTSGFEITGSIAFANTDSSLVIYNFKESFDEWHLNNMYTIIIGADANVLTGDNIQNAVKSHLEQTLKKNSLQYTLIEGNINASKDIQLDGSNDFILSNERFVKTNIFSSEQIILFDGKNKFSPTNIIARSDYTFENADAIPFIKEKLFFKENPGTAVVITLEHSSKELYSHTIKDDEYKEVELKINYKLTWRWNKKNNLWETGLISKDFGNKLFYQYTDKLTELSYHDNYYIQENCQNGGVNYFQLSRTTSELSDYFLIKDNYDDVANNIALAIVEIDGNNQLLIVARGGEAALEGNTKALPKIGTPFYKWIIEKNTNEQHKDIIKISGLNAYYTSEPDNYTYKSCD
jgi:hypothetical protein